MGRNKLIEDELLLNLFDKFLLEVCGGTLEHFQFSTFSNYIISQGYKGITPRLLRRSEILRTHISELSNSKADEDRQKVLVFKTLDVDLICSKRNNSEYLRNVLTQTDAYYHSLYEYASTITRENHKLKQELKQAKLNKKESVQKAEEIRQSYKEEKNSVSQLQLENKKLRELIDTYLYPEIANELLRKKGLLQGGNEYIDPAMVDKNLITAKTELKKEEAVKQTKSGSNAIIHLFDKLES